MPSAAVPSYLGQDFSAASPGLRFGLYLQIWTDRQDQEKEIRQRAKAESEEGHKIRNLIKQKGIDRTIQALLDHQFCKQEHLKPLPAIFTKNDFAARKAWREISRISPDDHTTQKALLVRQRAAFAARAGGDDGLCIEAKAIAPFTTGLGNEHPLENGFAFLNPYGLPYLPGSGVKGVLRRAAQELAAGLWGDSRGWSLDERYVLEVGSGEEKRILELSMLDVLFGREPAGDDSNHFRGVLSFWDVFPQIPGNQLMVEVMTPHYTHYYQQKKSRESGQSTTPHDSGQPNPIVFLTVPPGSSFVFHVLCDLVRLKLVAPDLLKEEGTGPRWKMLLAQAFEHAFCWLGFGAKTAVGYGAMQWEPQNKSCGKAELGHGAQAQQEADREAETLSANLRRIREFEEYMQGREEQLLGGKVKPHGEEHRKAVALAKALKEEEGWTAEERREAAKVIKEWLPRVVQINIKEELKRLQLREFLADDVGQNQ